MERTSLNPLRELTLLSWLLRLIAKSDRRRTQLYHQMRRLRWACGTSRRSGQGQCGHGMGYIFISPSLKAQLLRPLLRLLMRAAFGGDRASLILQNADDVQLFERARIIPLEQIRLVRSSALTARAFFAE